MGVDEGGTSVRRLDGGELGAEVVGERRVERLGVSLLALISLSDLGALDDLDLPLKLAGVLKGGEGEVNVWRIDME